MKLQTTTNTIERIGNVSNETGFRMRSSRKAFQILSDLYSDKPLAIVRELGCNAHDSHVAAGKKDVPFHIHAPNALEPWLTIQDYGTGISPDDVCNIYAVYFESTKTTTNDQIGCLGLGSKSPFCYTDNFTIISNYNGEKRTYNAYFNSDSLPTISLFSVETTGEGNGISIQIPVKPNDFGSFHNAIKKSFRFFDVRPTITGGMVQWDDETPVLAGNDWSVYKAFGYNEAYAIMGGVTYPLDVYKIDEKVRHLVSRSGVVLRFETGDLDIVPSREGLSYNDQTIKALNEKVVKVIEEIKASLSDTLAKQTNILDAIRTYNLLESRFSMFTSATKNILWNNIDVSYPNKLVWDAIKEAKINQENALVCFERRNWGRGKTSTSTSPNFHEKTDWFVNDLPRGGYNRVRQYAIEKSEGKAIIITDEVHKVLIGMGFPDSFFSKASTLPSPAKVRKAQGSVKATKQVVYSIGHTYQTTWESEELDVSNPPKYYIVKGKTWDFSLSINGLYDICSKDRLLALMDYMGIGRSEVVMVSQKTSKILAGISTDFVEYANANLNLEYDPNDKATLDKYFNSNNYATYRIEEMMKTDSFKDLPDDNAFKVNVTKLFAIREKLTSGKIVGIFNQIKKDQQGTPLALIGDSMTTYIVDSMFEGNIEPSVALGIITRLKD